MVNGCGSQWQELKKRKRLARLASFGYVPVTFALTLLHDFSKSEKPPIMFAVVWMFRNVVAAITTDSLGGAFTGLCTVHGVQRDAHCQLVRRLDAGSALPGDCRILGALAANQEPRRGRIARPRLSGRLAYCPSGCQSAGGNAIFQKSGAGASNSTDT